MKVGNDITVEENMIIIYSNARVGFVFCDPFFIRFFRINFSR